MKQNILVPFDGSANATEALRVAIDMAKAFNEKIVLLNVQPSYETPHTKQFFSKKQIQEYQAQMADEALQPGVDILKKSGVGFLSKTRSGDPREQICAEARGDSAEGGVCKGGGLRMIVMGSRGMNAILGSILGSVSTGVLHNTPCPVTIVPYSC
ncbi:MAG: putative universal stress protein [Deltaproteobacteria bacterium]|nr:putative universal stress protein [Deltaproteobacteria bacterium]